MTTAPYSISRFPRTASAAFKRAAMALLAEVVSNRDYAYWERVDGNHRAFTKAYPMPELPSIRRAA
ncbi:MAG: hypothetical protein IPN21_18275 [Burkholderiales bacterium]|nr:hypothetical protein [Burkholderiales bacterium]